MKIEINEHGTIVLKEIFNPIKLVTADNETLIITMRDSGFEVCYENEFYELKQGNVSKYSRQSYINNCLDIESALGKTSDENCGLHKHVVNGRF